MPAAPELIKQLQQWRRRLEPGHALALGQDEADRELYVDLDAFVHAGQTHHLRGRSAVIDIVRDLRLASGFGGASTHLFSGFRGTGKTTELNRLARELEALGDFVVLRVSARDYHHLSEALDVEELALMLAMGIGEAAERALGEAQLGALSREGVAAWVHARLVRLFDDAELSLKFGPVQLKPALRSGTSLRADLRAALRERPNALQDFLHDFVRDVATAVGPRQLVVIIDDLEKYNVPRAEVASVYHQMARLFFHSPQLLKLPLCHTIYTVPPYLAFINPGIAEIYDGRLHVLPSVKLRSRPPERTPHPPGRAALEAVLAERVDLDALFGAQRSACVERIVAASGGNLRDLFVLTAGPIMAAVDEGLPAGLAAVEATIQKQASVRQGLLAGPYAILSKVRVRGDLVEVEEAELGDFAAAMDQHLLLCHWNGEFWYDVHPLVEASLE